MKNIFQHSPQGFRPIMGAQGEASLTVLSSGFLKIISLKPSEYSIAPGWQDIVSNITEAATNREVFLTPSEIATVEFPPAVTYAKNDKSYPASSDWDFTIAQTQNSSPSVEEEYTVAFTSVAVIGLHNGTKHLVASSEDGFNKALSVANRILHRPNKAKDNSTVAKGP